MRLRAPCISTQQGTEPLLALAMFEKPQGVLFDVQYEDEMLIYGKFKSSILYDLYGTCWKKGQQPAPFARLLVRLSSRRVGCLSGSEFELARSDFDFDELAR